MVRPLLFQILNEAGDFPVELHHHPGLEKTQKEIVAEVTWCIPALGFSFYAPNIYSNFRSHSKLIHINFSH